MTETRSARRQEVQSPAAHASTSAVTVCRDVDMTWMRCLDKRDHVIPDGAEYLGAGQLKAACNTRIYPLGVSAESPRRRCRACIKAVRAVSKSPLQRIPDQRTRSRVVSEVREPLMSSSSALPSGPRGTPVREWEPDRADTPAGRGSTLSPDHNRRGPSGR